MSVVKLTLQDHEKVLELISDELIHYQFLISDLLDNNYQSDSFQVFGEFDHEGRLASILVNNFNNLTYYAKTDRSVDVYLDTIKNCNFTQISGPSWLVEKLIPYVKVSNDTLSYLGVVKEVKAKRRYFNLPLQTINNEAEIGMQYDLLASASEFNMQISREEYIQKEIARLRASNDRTVFLSIEDKMVSSCSTIRESRNSAIIIGVVTHPSYRGNGYGTEVLIGLFDQLLQEGKYPYLFYNNPAARSVYLKLGMTEVCEWRVVTLEN